MRVYVIEDRKLVWHRSVVITDGGTGRTRRVFSQHLAGPPIHRHQWRKADHLKANRREMKRGLIGGGRTDGWIGRAGGRGGRALSDDTIARVTHGRTKEDSCTAVKSRDKAKAEERRSIGRLQRWQKRNVNFVKQQLPGLACCC